MLSDMQEHSRYECDLPYLLRFDLFTMLYRSKISPFLKTVHINMDSSVKGQGLSEAILASYFLKI